MTVKTAWAAFEAHALSIAKALDAKFIALFDDVEPELVAALPGLVNDAVAAAGAGADPEAIVQTVLKDAAAQGLPIVESAIRNAVDAKLAAPAVAPAPQVQS